MRIFNPLYHNFSHNPTNHLNHHFVMSLESEVSKAKYKENPVKTSKQLKNQRHSEGLLTFFLKNPSFSERSEIFSHTNFNLEV